MIVSASSVLAAIVCSPLVCALRYYASSREAVRFLTPYLRLCDGQQKRAEDLTGGEVAVPISEHRQRDEPAAHRRVEFREIEQFVQRRYDIVARRVKRHERDLKVAARPIRTQRR